MATSFGERVARALNGDLVRDWGLVSDRKPGFFRERICMALRDHHGDPVLTLTYKFSSAINYNAFTFAISASDLAAFVSALQSGYDHLQVLAASPQAVAPGPPDALPLSQRLLLKLIHGIRTSKLLLDHKCPKSGETEYRFYGYVTRKSAIKMFIQSDLDISFSRGHVISGEGFQAALQVLSDHLQQGAFEVAGQ